MRPLFLLALLPLLGGLALMRPRALVGRVLDDRLSRALATLKNHEERISKLEGRGG